MQIGYNVHTRLDLQKLIHLIAHLEISQNSGVQNLVCTSNSICILNLHRLLMIATVMEYRQTN